jgi:uncharacterized repeat protein (TIGR03803 family)
MEMKSKFRVNNLRVAIAIITLLLAASSGSASGNPKLVTLYTFTGGNDGGNPNGAVAFDRSGNIYGTAATGGKYNSCDQGGYCGVVFRLARPAQKGEAWKLEVLYDEIFSETPHGSVIFDQHNNLYSPSASNAELYEIVAPGNGWNAVEIYSAGVYGQVGPPIFDALGNLYTTSSAGPDSGDSGYVSKLTPMGDGTWNATTLFTFSGGTDGGAPFGVIMDREGNLYGTAGNGGTGTGCIDGSLCGLIYELSPQSGGTWQENVLYDFQASDGEAPFGAALAADSKGNLYGVISGGGAGANCPYYGGCGEVFEVSPPATKGGTWTETVIHRFQGGSSDGSNAMTGLTIDPSGNLYGVTEFGGSGFCLDNGVEVGCGTIFELSPPSGGGKWTETILHNYQGGSDGEFPAGNGLVFKSGALYGSTNNGGSYGKGTIFELIP